MRNSLNRVVTVAVLCHRSAAASSFLAGNKTAIYPWIVRRATTSSSSMDRFEFHRLDSTESTQDEARRLIDNKSKKCLAVTAKEQTRGRGTTGRQWVGMSGNVFLTVAIPMDSVPVMITLLPIKVGTIVANTVSQLLQKCQSLSKVTVKWPNDVLVDQRKIAGVLIETETTKDNTLWLLVGIGVNLKHAPSVPTAGPNRGRPSTSVLDSCGQQEQQQQRQDDLQFLGDASVVASDIASALVDWIHDNSSTKEQASRRVVEEWTEWATFGGQQVLRDTEENEIVVPLGIEQDGQLRVRGQDGRERLLVADYLL